MAMRIPHWAGVGVAVVAVTVLGAAYVTAPDMEGRTDACLGNTAPIERGAMLNRCDHAVSVLACPLEAEGGECVESAVAAGAPFAVAADIKVVAHACRAPYRATIADDDNQRGCRAPE